MVIKRQLQRNAKFFADDIVDWHGFKSRDHGICALALDQMQMPGTGPSFDVFVTRPYRYLRMHDVFPILLALGHMIALHRAGRHQENRYTGIFLHERRSRRPFRERLVAGPENRRD
jgi:hypothetical protein